LKILKDRILRDGRVLPGGIIKVDSFINHQIDPNIVVDIGREFAARFRGEGITRIVTIEASGIAIAFMTGLELGVPVVFAKKGNVVTQEPELYHAVVRSATRGITYRISVGKSYLWQGDRVLIIDDFLASGEAALGLADIVTQSGATLVGMGFVIEKSFAGGRQRLAGKTPRIESLAIIEELDGESIRFAQ
jgi:xanthine phosphoribosyltransferase